VETSGYSDDRAVPADEADTSQPASEFDVRYDVPLIAQPDGMTCWAAALAMIESYRDQASYGVDYFRGARAAPLDDVVADRADCREPRLHRDCPADFLPAAWRDLLATHGPLWIVVKAGGTLLAAAPPPAEGPDGTTLDQPVFAIPGVLIIVRNLSVSGQWSARATQALSSSSASIGPLTLFGATSSAGRPTTYSRTGMQVVALLCATLPMLPPNGDPSMASTSTAPPPGQAPA
jgi:Papain-like cysteine protease AvrRpt2